MFRRYLERTSISEEYKKTTKDENKSQNDDVITEQPNANEDSNENLRQRYTTTNNSSTVE